MNDLLSLVNKNKLLERNKKAHAETINLAVKIKKMDEEPAMTSGKLGAVNPSLGNSKNADNKKFYHCVLCEEKFAEHNLMIEHFRKHGERKQIRALSPSKVTSKDKEHLADLIKCEWCSGIFETISKAIEHKFRKHRYESTNYFCKDCGKLFPLKIALEQHNYVEHKKPKTQPKQDENKCLFLCKYCSVSFSSLEAVKFHENGAHQIQKRLQVILPPASKKVKVNNQGEVTTLYYCHLCGNEYMVKYNLMKHLDMCHTVEEKTTTPTEGIIKCRACEAIFYNDKAYNVHNIHHKPDDLYVTSEEQRQKVVDRVDQDFDISRVPSLPKNMAQPLLKPILIKKLKRLDTSQVIVKKITKDSNAKPTDVNSSD